MYRRVPSFMALLFVAHGTCHGQGCVAIRGFSSCSPNAFGQASMNHPGWQLGTNYRYFESFRHFRGTHEEVDRLTENTEVINFATQVTLSATCNLDRRRGFSIILPYSYFVRSSLYEHGRTERHTSRSNGIGDLRLSYHYWLWNPDSTSSGNLMVSAGIKLPTGNRNAMDYFYNVGPDTLGEYRPVDQSIQLGDGGVGLTVELQGYLKFAEHLHLFGNAFYLLNPMDVNGTRTYRETLSPILSNEAIMSVADQFMARAGINWGLPHQGWSISCAGRIEGIPVNDLWGASNGFRRPGYVISVEPGVGWMNERNDFSITAPIALKRDRTQSVTDKENSARTGTFRQGDAAFADWLLNITWTYQLGATSSARRMHPAP